MAPSSRNSSLITAPEIDSVCSSLNKVVKESYDRVLYLDLAMLISLFIIYVINGESKLC